MGKKEKMADKLPIPVIDRIVHPSGLAIITVFKNNEMQTWDYFENNLGLELVNSYTNRLGHVVFYFRKPKKND
jgi:hypothetical protein